MLFWLIWYNSIRLKWTSLSLFFLADMCKWGSKPAFRGVCLFIWATSLKHSIPLPDLHFVKPSVLLPRGLARWIQSVNVLCVEFLHVPLGKWRTSAGCCFFVERCFLECPDSGIHTSECHYLIRSNLLQVLFSRVLGFFSRFSMTPTA